MSERVKTWLSLAVCVCVAVLGLLMESCDSPSDPDDIRFIKVSGNVAGVGGAPYTDVSVGITRVVEYLFGAPNITETLVEESVDADGAFELNVTNRRYDGISLFVNPEGEMRYDGETHNTQLYYSETYDLHPGDNGHYDIDLRPTARLDYTIAGVGELSEGEGYYVRIGNYRPSFYSVVEEPTRAYLSGDKTHTVEWGWIRDGRDTRLGSRDVYVAPHEVTSMEIDYGRTAARSR